MASFNFVNSSSEAFKIIILPLVHVFSDIAAGRDLEISRLGLLPLLWGTPTHLNESERAFIEECIAISQILQIKSRTHKIWLIRNITVYASPQGALGFDALDVADHRWKLKRACVKDPSCLQS